jgi:cold shock CspA family protein
VIVKYIEKLGYGFVQPAESRQQVFFHGSDLTGSPEVGALVEFEVINDPHKQGKWRA